MNLEVSEEIEGDEMSGMMTERLKQSLSLDTAKNQKKK